MCLAARKSPRGAALVAGPAVDTAATRLCFTCPPAVRVAGQSGDAALAGVTAARFIGIYYGATQFYFATMRRKARLSRRRNTVR
jgi:hypothetical protein